MLNGQAEHNNSDEIYFRTNGSVLDGTMHCPAELSLPGSVANDPDPFDTDERNQVGFDKVCITENDGENLLVLSSTRDVLQQQLIRGDSKKPMSSFEEPMLTRRQNSDRTLIFDNFSNGSNGHLNGKQDAVKQLRIEIDKDVISFGKSSNSKSKIWEQVQQYGKGIISVTEWLSPINPSKKKLVVETPRRSWARSRIAPARSKGKSILMTPAKKVERADKKLKTKRLRKGPLQPAQK
jgi:hypothetical protein